MKLNALKLNALRLNALAGTIKRRALINYRIDPDIAASLLPAPLSPALVDGYAIAGICIIQLEVRPPWMPKAVAFQSINGAHRIAAVLPDGSDAVYVPRRDTNARLNVLAGGRLFPGEQHLASITFTESNDEVAVKLEGNETRVAIAGRVADDIPESSVFSSLSQVSDFFERGSLGFSDTARVCTLDGIELRTTAWSVEALEVDHVESTFFNDRSVFPTGSAELDNALLMRNVDHSWHRRESLDLT